MFALVSVDAGVLCMSPQSLSDLTTRLEGEHLSFTSFLVKQIFKKSPFSVGQLEEKMLTAVRIFRDALVTIVFCKWTCKPKSYLELQLLWVSSIFDSISTSPHTWGTESQN